MKPMASISFNFIQKLSFLIKSKKSCQENKEVPSQQRKPENVLMEIQKILIWDDPFFTVCYIISVNIVYWLMIYLDLKFYGIVFTTLLILTCEQLWMEHFSKYLNKNKSENLSSSSSSKKVEDSSARISTLFRKGMVMLKESYTAARFLRQSQPEVFCILTCLGFLLLAVIGRSFSGVVAFYILLMLIMTVPGVLNHFLPPYFIKDLSELFYSSRKETYNSSDDEVEPFLPDSSEEALELLQLAGDLRPLNKEDDEESSDLLLDRISENTSQTTESVCSRLSLCPESVIMPSPENSLDFWEFDLNLGEKAELNETENNGINFQSQHFDGDSSEEEFVKGLDLTKETTKKKGEVQQNSSSLIPQNLVLLDKKFLSNNIESKNSAGLDKESSSDTDSFELISEEDM